MDQEERNELAEDEEKLQLALQEAANEDEDWYHFEDDEGDDEEGLMIDLDAPSSTTGHSSSGYVESGVHGHFMTIDEETLDGRSIPRINVPSEEKADAYTAEKTLALNQALQEILETRIESIQAALEINKEKQLRLNEGAWADIESRKSGKGRTWGPFRTPFFKSNEADSYPPDNEDTIQKRRNNELHYDSMKEHMLYNSTNKHNLIQALVEDTKEALMKPVMNKLEIEIKKATELRNSADEKVDDIRVLHKKWKALRETQREMMERKTVDSDDLEDNNDEMEETKEEMANEEAEYSKRLKSKQEQDAIVTGIEDELRQTRNLTNNEILERVDPDKVDWMKLSKSWFKDSTSWVDCQKAWEFMVNPRINLNPWCEEEEAQLLELAKEHEAGEWDVVAQKLGTCRTPFHCFYHYQSRFNPDFKSRPWKKEEDVRLNEAVKRVRETSATFTWGKVAALINSRSSVECRQRYSRIGEDRNFGRWSKEEDARLIMAVGSLGFNWLKVSKFIGNRTVMQCKRRYTHCLNPELNFFHFTYEDDRKLLTLYKKFGRQWVKIATHFKGRTDAMIKSRFGVLEKWRKESDWWDGLDETSKNLLLGKNLTIEERKHFEGEWKSFYNMKLGVADKDYRRQEIDKENGLDPDIIPPRPPIYLKYSKFQGGFAERKHAVWSKRLNEHHLILQNLKKRFEEDNSEEKDSNAASTAEGRDVAHIKSVLKNNRLKDKDLTDDERRLRDLMSNTLEEIKSESQYKKLPSAKMTQLLSALNLHFLGDSNIHVSDILKSTQVDRATSLRAVATHRRKLNLRIRRILAKNKWVFLKSRLYGRHPFMRAIPVDNRIPEVIERESKDWDKGVPSLLMRRLGGDSQALMKSIKERILTVEKNKKELSHYEDDSRYKAQMKMQKKKENEIRSLWHLSKEKRDKLEMSSNKKRKVIIREFSKAYALKRELFDGEIEAGKRDLEYMQNTEKDNPLIQDKQNFQTCSASTSSADQSSSSSQFLSTAKHMLGDLDEIETGNMTYGTINFLPPSLATLTALRALLLHRQQLMKTAGFLYNPDHYKRKRKHQLHIILDSDDDEENEMDDANHEMIGTEKKVPRQPTIKAVEVVEGEDGENGNEINCNDSWFKTPDSKIADGENSSVDRNLEKRGNLPSTSFAPYDRKSQKLIPNPLYVNRINLTKDISKFMEKAENKKDFIPHVSVEHEESSNYEVMFGPASLNIKKTLTVNPDIKLTKPVFKHNDEGEDKDANPSEVIDLSTENDSVEKSVEIIENVDNEKIMGGTRFKTVGRDCRSPKSDEAETCKLMQTIEGWKKSKAGDDLKNVVVVGLSQDKNEIVHYNADDVTKSTDDGVQNVDSSQPGPSHSIAKSNKGKFTVTFAPVRRQSTSRKDAETHNGPTDRAKQKMAANMPRLVNRMIEKRDQMADSEKVVVVGVDPNSGRVTHYTHGSKVELPSVTAVPDASSVPKKLDEMTETELKDYMAKVRDTDEYQRMLTRFRALFMWPVLMSTTKPESEISLPVVNVPQPVKRSLAKKPKGRPTKPKGNDTKRKKKPVVEPKPQSQRKRPRLDYATLLPKSERPQRAIKKPDYVNNSGPPSFYRKFKPPHIKRKAMLPDWWKDVISEVMVKKKEIEGGEGDNYEIDINDDEDFVDKGDYSDDEWLAELKEEEKKKEDDKRRKEGETEGRREEEESREMADDSVGDEEGKVGSSGDEEGKVGSSSDEEDQETKTAGSDVDINVGHTFCIVGEDGNAEEVILEIAD